MFFFKKRPAVIHVYCDGGIGDNGHGAGLGVVVRDARHEIIGLVKRGMPPVTNTEAEYAALVLALQTVQRYHPRLLKVYMDSEVVIGQMIGRYNVRSLGLKTWHAQACRLARRFGAIEYQHIPREANRLADALAGEALAEWAAGGGKPA